MLNARWFLALAILTLGGRSYSQPATPSTPPQSNGLDADFIVRVCAGIVNQQITISRGTFQDQSGATLSWSNGDTIVVTRSGDISRTINNVGQGDYNSCVAKFVQGWSSQAPRSCQIRQNGVDHYTRSFTTTGSSPEMSGGHSPAEWCNTMIGNLRGQHPDGRFTAVGSSESSRSGCAPFNCPLYTYQCSVSVDTEPVFKEATSSLCP